MARITSPSFIGTLALLLGLPSMTGCATLFAGAPTELTVAVEEPSLGAAITVETLPNGELVGPQGGPGTFYLRRATDYKVTVEGDGYATREFVVGRRLHPAAVLNATPLLASLYILPMSFIVSSYSVPGQESPESRANRLILGTFAVAGAMFAIDFFTGKLYQHELDQLRVRLERLPRLNHGRSRALPEVENQDDQAVSLKLEDHAPVVHTKSKVTGSALELGHLRQDGPAMGIEFFGQPVECEGNLFPDHRVEFSQDLFRAPFELDGPARLHTCA